MANLEINQPSPFKSSHSLENVINEESSKVSKTNSFIINNVEVDRVKSVLDFVNYLSAKTNRSFSVFSNCEETMDIKELDILLVGDIHEHKIVQRTNTVAAAAFLSLTGGNKIYTESNMGPKMLEKSDAFEATKFESWEKESQLEEGFELMRQAVDGVLALNNIDDQLLILKNTIEQNIQNAGGLNSESKSKYINLLSESLANLSQYEEIILSWQSYVQKNFQERQNYLVNTLKNDALNGQKTCLIAGQFHLTNKEENIEETLQNYLETSQKNYLIIAHEKIEANEKQEYVNNEDERISSAKNVEESSKIDHSDKSQKPKKLTSNIEILNKGMFLLDCIQEKTQSIVKTLKTAPKI